MQWKPNVTVAALIHEDNRFLLVEEEADNRIVINQPAGHLERNENIIDAVIREAAEETCRIFVPEYLVGIYLYPHPDMVDITYLRFCFSGTCNGVHSECTLDEGIIRTIWMTRSELRDGSLNLRSPLVTKCIDDFLSGNRFPLDILDQSLLEPV